jgi:ADP-heptose:LPS heptosyltransferase
VATPPDWRARAFRVLYVRYEAVGDLIMATGVIRAIAQSHPTITVDVLASERNYQVLDHNPRVGCVLRLDSKQRRRYPGLLRRLRTGGYDVVVDGRVNHPPVFTTTPLLMAAARAPLRIGAAPGDEARRVYNLAVPFFPRTVSYTERTTYLVEPFGVHRGTTDFRPEIFLSDAEREVAETRWRCGGQPSARRLLVNLSASDVRRRRWPDERFVEVIRYAAHTHGPDLRILVIALPNEWASAAAVAAAAGAEAAPTRGVREAFALVGTSDVVFTPDTAIAHAAAAFDRPAAVMIARPGMDYAPHSARARLAIYDGWFVRDLPVAAAITALDEVLASARRSCERSSDLGR